MKTFYVSVLILVIAVMSGCTSGKKSFEHGDYYTAVIKSVNRLRQNPDHKKSKKVLKLAYPLALSTIEMEANRLLESNLEFKYCDAIDKYAMINQMYDDIKRCPGALRVIPSPKSYHHRSDDLAEYAAEERYAAGLKAMNRNTRRAAKEAYYHFKDADSYVAGYKDVTALIDKAHFMATLKVVVDQIPVPAAYSLSSGFFQDQVESFLHDRYRTNEFVRFYTQREAEDLEYVDQYMRLAFDDFVVGQVFLNKTTETFTKDSVVVGQVTLEDGTVVDAYNTVSAKLNKWHKETISEGLLSMRIYNAKTNAVLSHQKFDGQFVWVSEWGNYNGDERALTDEQLAICNSVEAIPPPPQELFIEFTRPIYARLTDAMSRFYSKY